MAEEGNGLLSSLKSTSKITNIAIYEKQTDTYKLLLGFINEDKENTYLWYLKMMVSNSIKAVLWMMGAVLSFTSMAIAGREMAVELDTFEIMIYRSLIGLVIVLVVGGFAGSLTTITQKAF